MARYRNPRLATRFTWAFGALATLVTVLAWLAWRTSGEAAALAAQRVRGDDVVATINELEAAVQPVASRAVCAATGGPALSAEDLAPPTWPAIATRLLGLLLEQPEMLDAAGAMRRELLLYEQSFADPLRKACAQQQRLGAAEVQSRLRVTAPQRARVQDEIKRLRNMALEQRRKAFTAADEASAASRRWLGLMSIASVLMAVSALAVVRSFALRVEDAGRRLEDESQERGIAQEQLALAQRRMRVVIDHVRDAVLAFDGQGRVQWINPAGEDLFGVERKVLHGCPVTQIIPGLTDAVREATSVGRDAAAVVDEHGLPWTSTSLLLEGRRTVAGPASSLRSPAPDGAASGIVRPGTTDGPGTTETVLLEASLVQTRIDGQAVGVCVLRLSDKPRPAEATWHLPDGSGDARMDLRDGARAAIEACATPAHVRDARVSLNLDDEALWIDADPGAVRDVLATMLLKALDGLPQGGEIGFTVMRVGGSARAVISDAGSGLAQTAAFELGSAVPGDQAEAPDSTYGGSLAQARDVAKANGGALGFRPRSGAGDEAVWAQWPLAEDAARPWVR